MIDRSFIAAAVALALCAGATAQEQTIRIGVAGPLSGASAHSGKDDENGARLAIEDLNRAPPTIGGHPIRFEEDAGDDQATPTQATAVAQKFCDDKVAGVVGHYTSGATIPASRIYHDCGLALVNPSSSSPLVTRQGFDTTFRIISNDEGLVDALARYAIETLKAQRIAVIDDRTAYGQGAADLFAKAVQADGGGVLERQFTSPTMSDFAAVLTALKDKQPQVIFYGGLDSTGGPLIRQARELGMTAKVFGTGGLCTGELANLAGAANVERAVVCTTGGGLVSALPGGTRFEERYRATYHDEVQAYAPFYYDAVMVLADAMRRANSVDPRIYLKALAATDMTGITGRIRFNEQGDIRERPVMLITYEGGKKVLLQEVK